MVAIAEPLRSKIERRAKRAWSRHDEGDTKRVHRISGVTDSELRYRLPHKRGSTRYSGKKVLVTRTEDGMVEVPSPRRDPPLDLRRKSQLSALKDHDGPVRAYKATKANGQGWNYGGITYEVGKSYEEKGASTDASQDCAAGINVASLDWCKGQSQGRRVFAVEFDSEDVAIIPRGSDGKLRVFRCTVVEELDLAEPAPAPARALPGPEAAAAPAAPPPPEPKPKRSPAAPAPAPAPEPEEELLRDTETLLSRIRNWFRSR